MATYDDRFKAGADRCHSAASSAATTLAGGSRSTTPLHRWPLDQLPGCGNNGYVPSRTPTPQQWARDEALLRHVSQTPPLTFKSSQAQRKIAPRPHSARGDYSNTSLSLSRGLSHQPDTEATSFMDLRKTTHGRGSEILPPIETPLRQLSRQSEVQGVHEAEANTRHSDVFRTAGGFAELFNRATNVNDDALVPTRSLPGPPESKAALKVLEDARRKETAFGGMPYQSGTRRVPRDVPPRPAAPTVRPHNAWCTFVVWTPLLDGHEDLDFHYELRCQNDSTDEILLMQDLGAEPQVQIDGLEAKQTYFFQVRGKNKLGAGAWSFWSEPYTVPKPLMDGTGLRPLAHGCSTSKMPYSAVLEWEEPCSHGAQIYGYKVEYGLDPDDQPTLKQVMLLNRRTKLEVSDLEPNHLYYFRVCALNEAGESDWTPWSEGVTTKAVVPAAPPPPTIAEAKARELTVRWVKPFCCGFEIIRWDVRVSCEDPSMETAIEMNNDDAAVLDDSSIHSRTLRIRDLQPITSYYFQVRAVSAIGVSAWSATSTALKTEYAVPDHCQDLRVVKNVVGCIVLQWSAPESYGLPVSSFVVKWSDEARMMKDRGSVEVPGGRDVMKGAGFSCKITSVKPGARLFFNIAARNSVGQGAWSPPTDEVIACPDRPSVPDVPVVRARTTSSIEVEAVDDVDTNGSPILHFELRWATRFDMLDAMKCPGTMRLKLVDHAGKPVPASSIEKSLDAVGRQREVLLSRLRKVYTYAVTGLEERGPYYFQVRAVNAMGCSSWSDVSDAQYLKLSAPARMSAPTLHLAESCSSLLVDYVPPADLGSALSGNLQSFEMRFSRWPQLLVEEDADMEDPTTSRVSYMRWAAPEPGKLLRPDPVRAEGLTTGRSYAFQVRAMSSNGSGPWSDISELFETVPSPPEKPSPVTTVAAQMAFSQYSAAIRLALPEPNGRPVHRCKFLMMGPYWPNAKVDSWPKTAEWNDLYDVEAEDIDESVEETFTDPLEPVRTRLWDHTVLHMEAGATYRFMYCCANDVGWSEWSDPSEEITMLPSEPERCPVPEVVEEEAHYVIVKWTPPFDSGSDITHYSLEWTADCRLQRFNVVENIPEDAYKLEGLQPNKSYWLRVAAHNSCGIGQYSEIDIKTCKGLAHTASTVPGQPTDVKAVAIEDKAGAARISWQAPLEHGGHIVSRYRVAYSIQPDMNDATETVQKSYREMSLFDLKPDTVYYFDVAAINAVGIGKWTGKPATCKTNPVPPEKFVLPKRPSKPEQTLSVVDSHAPLTNPVIGCQIRVAWKCPEDYDPKRGFIYDAEKQTHPILHYNVRLLVFKEQPESILTEVDPSLADDVLLKEEIKQVRDRRTVPKDDSNVVIFEGALLKPGRFYYASVQAINLVGGSPWSHSSEGCRAPAGAPDSVGESGIEAIEKTWTSITVEWTIPFSNGEAIDHFHLRWREMRPEDDAALDENDLIPKSHAEALTDWKRDEDKGWFCARLVVDPFAPQEFDTTAGTAEGFRLLPLRLDTRRARVEGTGDDSGVASSTRLAKKSRHDSRLKHTSRPASKGGSRAITPLGGSRVGSRKGSPRNSEGKSATAGHSQVPTAYTDGPSAALMQELLRGQFGVEDLQLRGRWTALELKHATSYVFKVAAGNDIGVSGWSSCKPTRTASVAPSAPGPALGAPGTPNTTVSVTFAWEEPSDNGGDPILGYEVCWIRLAHGEDVPPASAEAIVNETPYSPCHWVRLPAEQRQHTSTGLRPGDAIVAIVRTWNIIGVSPWCRLPVGAEELESLATEPGPPGVLAEAPRFVVAASQDHRPYSLSVEWKCPETNGRPITGFQVQIVSALGGGAPEIAEQQVVDERWVAHPGGRTSVWIEGQLITLKEAHTRLDPGEMYCVKVRAVNSVGTAPAWSAMSAEGRAPPDLPDKPPPPRSPWQWPTAIEVRWQTAHMRGAECDGCALRYAQSSNMKDAIDIDEETAFGSLASRLIVVDCLPVASDPYYFQARVKNSVGWSEWSSPSDGYGTGACRPEVPPKFVATEVGTDSMNLTWGYPDDHGAKVTAYELILCDPGAETRLRETLDQINKLSLNSKAETSKITAEIDRIRQEDEDRKTALIKAFKPQEMKMVLADNLADSQAPKATFGGLLGGLEYAASVRAYNKVGWGDWCPVLGPITTLASTPEVCPKLTQLEATRTSLLCEYRLPYNNGSPITRIEVEWTRISGPVDRHLALGGDVQIKHESVYSGNVLVELERPGEIPAPALPRGSGGAGNFTVAGLDPGTEYELKCRAVNEIGPGPYSFAVRMFCAPGIPDAPTRVRHTSRTDPHHAHQCQAAEDEQHAVPRPPAGPPPSKAIVLKGPRTINFASLRKAANPDLELEETKARALHADHDLTHRSAQATFTASVSGVAHESLADPYPEARIQVKSLLEVAFSSGRLEEALKIMQDEVQVAD